MVSNIELNGYLKYKMSMDDLRSLNEQELKIQREMEGTFIRIELYREKEVHRAY